MMNHFELSSQTPYKFPFLLTFVFLFSVSVPAQQTEPKTLSRFNSFCQQHFGAKHESLVYQTFGKQLSIQNDEIWSYASASSAVLGWDTNLPARSYVEYGKTSSYGQQTSRSKRPFYVHVHHLTDLDPKTTYHYRLVVEDERGNRVTSEDRTFSTNVPGGAIPVPDKVSGPPYVLDQKGGTYVLAENVTADGTAFKIQADNITLDLNGHTATYNRKPVEIEGDKWRHWLEQSEYGVLLRDQTNFRLINGTIHQGAGDNAASDPGIGFNPFHGENVNGKMIIAGVTFHYGGDQMIGLNFHWSEGNARVHHCVFRDRSTDINNRHGGACRAMRLLSDQNGIAHHNLVERTRQMGLTGAKELYDNEIYVDSYSINSFAASVAPVGGEAHGNRIFGTGFNPYGFGWSKKRMKIHDNFVHLYGRDVSDRWHEDWGDINMLSAMRVTNYGDGGQKRKNLKYWNNTIVAEGKENCEIRAVEFFSDNSIEGLVFRDNLVKAMGRDRKTVRVACVNAQGHFRKDDTIPVVYRNNTFISNRHHVRFGDAYSKGLRHHFIDNQFVKRGNHPYFSTFYFGGEYWNYGHVIRDCTFKNGAAPNDVCWGRTGDKSWYQIEWTLTVEGPPGATVTVTNRSKTEVFSEEIDQNGSLRIPLAHARLRPPENHNWKQYEEGRGGSCQSEVQMKTPHRVTMQINDQTVRATVKITRPRRLKFENGKLEKKSIKQNEKRNSEENKQR